MTRADDRNLNYRNHIMQTEVGAILSDLSFRRSPTLSKLLQYLVDETIAGRGEGLKSYTLAVDALGRAEDYDPSSDSSARVQMIRLRKALESYYAKNPPKEKLCIYLQAGSYLVRLDEPSLAYPTLYRLNDNAELSRSVDSQKTVHAKHAKTAAAVPPPRISNTSSFWRLLINHRAVQIVLVTACIGLAAFGVIWLSRDSASSNNVAYTRTPILEVAPIQTNGSDKLEPLTTHLQGVYASDLPRFKFAKVRLNDGRTRPTPSAGGKANYILYSRLVLAANDDAKIILNVEDTEKNTVVWTNVVVVSLDPEIAHNQVVPILGQILGPTGAIALHQSVLTGDANDGGYPCMLKYFEFIRTRASLLENQLGTCLEKPLVEKDIAATMLGIRAMFELERPAARTNFTAANARGIALARKAVSTDPNDAWANFAMARLAYAAGDCRSAIIYTDRTMDANPNSPLFPAVLASLAPVCKYPHSAQLLDQALLTQSPLYIRSRLLLVQAAIFQGTPEKIALVKDSELPETDQQKRYYYATETLIDASQGKVAEANANWAKFREVSEAHSETTDEKLAAVIVIPAMRKLFITYLQNAGVDL